MNRAIAYISLTQTDRACIASCTEIEYTLCTDKQDIVSPRLQMRSMLSILVKLIKSLSTI